MDSYVDLFIEDMKKRGKSQATISAYKKDLKAFYTYLDKNGLLNIQRINKTNIIAYLYDLRQRGKSNATMTRALCVLRGFFKFLYYTDRIKTEPTAQVEIPREKERKLEISSEDRLKELITSIPISTSKGVRDRAMLMLMYDTGIRVSEMLELEVSSYNSQLKLLTVSKNKKTRFLPLSTECGEALELYINEARQEIKGEKTTEILFLNKKGDIISRQGFWKAIKSYYKGLENTKAEEKEITPQEFRQSFIKRCLEAKMPTEKLLELLGTEDLNSLKIYK